MNDLDESAPWASWDDKRIVAWARAHGYDQYPIAKVQLMTTHAAEPDIAEIDFRSRFVDPDVTRTASRSLFS